MHRISPEEAIKHPWLANYLKSESKAQTEQIVNGMSAKPDNRNGRLSKNIESYTIKETETGMDSDLTNNLIH